MSQAASRLPPDRFVCVVVHDVAASTRAACQRTLGAIAEVAHLPVTLLAVPRYHGEAPTSELEAWLSQRHAKGDELALHGYSHSDDSPPGSGVDHLRRRHYTRGEGEFWALPEAEAKRRIDAGIAWFRSNGWIWHGFVAPAWLLGPQAWPALEGRGFEYTATLRHLVHLPGRQRVASQSVVYSTSSAWRRRSSLAWNAVVSRLERGNPLLRIELHPRDADFAAIRRSWQAVLERALRDRRAVTVADFMRQARPINAGPSTLWNSTTAD
ncbi:MAG TPA: polysaccharide deacetylase family protein [Caldimonas sp.]|nr:polysaccharide deacetylase family protein [Caldimonas sp.]